MAKRIPKTIGEALAQGYAFHESDEFERDLYRVEYLGGVAGIEEVAITFRLNKVDDCGEEDDHSRELLVVGKGQLAFGRIRATPDAERMYVLNMF